MACLLVALILAATVLTVPTGDKLFLANAARTSPAFWRTAFPGAPMAEAIRELLRAQAMTVANDAKLKDDGDDPPPMNFNYDDYRASASRRDGAAAPSSGVLKLHTGSLNAAADGNGAAEATVFFLEDAVRVGGSLPLRSVLREATDAPAAGLVPPRLYTVRAVRTVVEGSGSSFVVCRSEAGRPDHAAAVAYGCRTAATSSSGPTRAYAVDVAGGRGDDDGAAVRMTVAVICYTDTSSWDTGHVVFRLLGVKPGGAAVCHALPDAQVVAVKDDEIIPAVSP